jgi:hypothetical protein
MACLIKGDNLTQPKMACLIKGDNLTQPKMACLIKDAINIKSVISFY